MKQLCTNIDFTTFLGSALGLQNSILKKQGLSLSRLINISHLVESLVLNSKIQFELGNTPIWEPYRNSIESTDLYRILSSHKGVISIIEEPIDKDDALIGEILKEISESIYEINMDCLVWAVNFREGIYNALKEFPRLTSFDDKTNNSFIDRYLEIIKETFSEYEQNSFRNAVKFLENHNIGVNGFHVLTRIALWEKYISKNINSIYSPHFSRQPLIYSSNSKVNKKNIHEWNMYKIKKIDKDIRDSILENEPEILIDYLSPVFLACLDKAKTPLDIIENALKIRTSKHAKSYRKESESLIIDELNDNFININQYKINLTDKTKDLNDFLYTHGKTKTVMTNFSLIIPNKFPLSWQRTIRKTRKIDKLNGEKSSYLLSDILKQSIAIYNVGERIQEIFGMEFKFDTNIITINKPMTYNINT